VRGGAPAGRLSRHGLAVLDGDRHAEQGPLVARSTPPVGLVGVGQGALGRHAAKGIQLRLEPVDPLQVELDELTRGDLAAPHHLRLAGGAGEGQVVISGVHAREG
jgi:hypothetical protein